jgi:hypothetical protein
VGTYQTAAGVDVPLAASWNGTSWKVELPVVPPKSDIGQLASVSCLSATSCVAVGSFDNDVTFDTLGLAESWNGTRWAVIGPTNPKGSADTTLSGVACSKSTCMAVGLSTNASFADVTLSEQWNAKKWVVEPSANPKGNAGAALSGVSCMSSTSCTAVGSYTASDFATVTLAETWGGKSWVVVSSPNPAGGDGADELAAVACTASVACTAVGQSGTSAVLAERYSG